MIGSASSLTWHHSGSTIWPHYTGRGKVPGPGGSRLGSKNVSSMEFKELFEHLVTETGLHPLRVLFSILRSRKAELRLAAAKAILPYRYAVQKTVHVDAPTQMILGWDIEDRPSDDQRRLDS